MLNPREPTPKPLTREYAPPIPLPEATLVSASAYILASTITSDTGFSNSPNRQARNNPRLDPDPRLTAYLGMPLLATVLLGMSILAIVLLRLPMLGINLGINLSLPWDHNPAAASLLQNHSPLKAKVSKDPELPNLRESPTGPYAEEFWEAMESEIGSLEDARNFVHRSPIPIETKVTPSTWGQRIKPPHADPYMTILIISLDVHHCRAFIHTLKGSATIYFG
jgi:hypothetical protein